MTKSSEKKSKPNRNDTSETSKPIYETRQAPTKKRPTDSPSEDTSD